MPFQSVHLFEVQSVTNKVDLRKILLMTVSSTKSIAPLPGITRKVTDVGLLQNPQFLAVAKEARVEKKDK